MIDTDNLQEILSEVSQWMVNYYKNLPSYPVTPDVQPGDISKQLANTPPEQSESFKDIFSDFNSIIMPGMTHWQHPKFFAYFPVGGSLPSLIAEILMATLSPQCMLWTTSPAANELETSVMKWLQKMLGLPEEMVGMIQDTASISNLTAIMCARETLSNYAINKEGFQGQHYTVYCSTEAHSSIDQAEKILGIGTNNLRKIPVDDEFAMKPTELAAAIEKDIKNGLSPCCVVATFGTTSTVGVDPIKEIGEICDHYNIWLHIDAAYLGSALILPEVRQLINKYKNVNSFVFNAHKWLFTHFDCSVYFVRDKAALMKTLMLKPAYLKTHLDSKVTHYSDMSIQLGRRFRALKLWFVIRSFGVKQMQHIIRQHIQWAKELEQIIRKIDFIEICTPAKFNVLTFRLHPLGADDEDRLNQLNDYFLQKINETHKIFLSHTELHGRFVLRIVLGQTFMRAEDYLEGWSIIHGIAKEIIAENKLI